PVVDAGGRAAAGARGTAAVRPWRAHNASADPRPPVERAMNARLKSPPAPPAAAGVNKLKHLAYNNSRLPNPVVAMPRNEVRGGREASERWVWVIARLFTARIR